MISAFGTPTLLYNGREEKGNLIYETKRGFHYSYVFLPFLVYFIFSTS